VNGQGPSVTIPASACSKNARADLETAHRSPFGQSCGPYGRPQCSTALTPEVAPLCEVSHRPGDAPITGLPPVWRVESG